MASEHVVKLEKTSLPRRSCFRGDSWSSLGTGQSDDPGHPISWGPFSRIPPTAHESSECSLLQLDPQKPRSSVSCDKDDKVLGR